MILQQFLKDNHPKIMGILNLTPDSFSDGGSHTDPDQAVQFALQMVDEGADIIDVGGESTRPKSERVSPQEQLRRVVGVVTKLRGSLPPDFPISIDTTSGEVAEASIAAGASIINDVRSGRDDEKIFELAVKKNVPLILMHMQGTPETMQIDPTYDDVVQEVKEFLLERCQKAQKLGVPKENLMIDPGIGFGKTQEHNLTLMASLEAFVATGIPVLLGTSRKRFLGNICDGTPAKDLIGATCTTTALGVQAGVRVFRVHDIMPNRQAADVAWAVHSSHHS